MAIAYRVQDYIAENGLVWDPVAHAVSQSCTEAARLAGVPPDCVAKAIVLKDAQGYVEVVIPANGHLDVRPLCEALCRDLRLATEVELQQLFSDCAIGAVPPVGSAYGLPTLWDESLGDGSDVYFEGGDHRTLVHMSGVDFSELMRSARALPRRSTAPRS